MLFRSDRILIVGSVGQAPRLAEYGRELAGFPVSVVTPADVPQFAALLADAAWVLSAETAAAHLATALDRPAVVLLGGGHFGQCGPWTRSARQRWLTHPLPCFDCAWACPHPEPWCLTRLTPEEVGAALAAVVAADQ